MIELLVRFGSALTSPLRGPRSSAQPAQAAAAIAAQPVIGRAFHVDHPPVRERVATDVSVEAAR
ncbi:hypothetical protein [Streptomyces sp. NL15-2K]|uniref:hypothetical protein n=1 Tax=Streptomyces sp. NL15-2K TaxID=376149 RepID=UPI000F5763BA|nr:MULTISPECIES: hypothetical protein [Actinomycetes]WKX06265.1 hypothetical protein Q4V64_01670 [Kutzneria buriramensis]